MAQEHILQRSPFGDSLYFPLQYETSSSWRANMIFSIFKTTPAPFKSYSDVIPDARSKAVLWRGSSIAGSSWEFGCYNYNFTDVLYI